MSKNNKSTILLAVIILSIFLASCNNGQDSKDNKKLTTQPQTTTERTYKSLYKADDYMDLFKMNYDVRQIDYLFGNHSKHEMINLFGIKSPDTEGRVFTEPDIGVITNDFGNLQYLRLGEGCRIKNIEAGMSFNEIFNILGKAEIKKEALEESEDSIYRISYTYEKENAKIHVLSYQATGEGSWIVAERIPVVHTFTDKESKRALSSIADVLLNKSKYFCTEYEEFIYLKDFHSDNRIGFDLDTGYYEYEENEYNTDINYQFDSFCVVDVDADGCPEVIVQPTHECVFLFRYEDDIVYGYLFTYRGMKCIKNDGTFEGSSSAVTVFTGRLDFTDGKCKDIELSSYDLYDSVPYRINGESVTEEEVLDYMKKQDEKEAVEWIKFSEENIEKYLGLAESVTKYT